MRFVSVLILSFYLNSAIAAPSKKTDESATSADTSKTESIQSVPAPAPSDIEKPVAVETTAADTIPPTPLEKVEGGFKKFKNTINTSRENRALNKSSISLLYSPFDLLIPSKYGAHFDYYKTGDRIYEFEYLRGSLSVPFFIDDLGGFSDERFSFSRRIFKGNSFNFHYGITYFKFKLHLGSDLLDSVSNDSSVDLVQVESIGFNVGVGHRWSISKNLTFGVDWFEWAQPVFITKEDQAFTDSSTSEEDKDDVEDAVKWISYFPRLSVLKISLGYTFK